MWVHHMTKPLPKQFPDSHLLQNQSSKMTVAIASCILQVCNFHIELHVLDIQENVNNLHKALLDLPDPLSAFHKLKFVFY